MLLTIAGISYFLMMSVHECDLRATTMVSCGSIVILAIILTQYFGVLAVAIAIAICLEF